MFCVALIGEPSRAFGTETLCSLTFWVKPMCHMTTWSSDSEVFAESSQARCLKKTKREKCNLSRTFKKNTTWSFIYMRAQLCISMREHEWNFLRLMIAWRTQSMLRIRNSYKVKLLDSYSRDQFSCFFTLHILFVWRTQRGTNKRWKPINYVLRKLTPVSYSTLLLSGKTNI